MGPILRALEKRDRFITMLYTPPSEPRLGIERETTWVRGRGGERGARQWISVCSHPWLVLWASIFPPLISGLYLPAELLQVSARKTSLVVSLRSIPCISIAVRSSLGMPYATLGTNLCVVKRRALWTNLYMNELQGWNSTVGFNTSLASWAMSSECILHIRRKKRFSFFLLFF